MVRAAAFFIAFIALVAVPLATVVLFAVRVLLFGLVLGFLPGLHEQVEHLFEGEVLDRIEAGSVELVGIRPDAREQLAHNCGVVPRSRIYHVTGILVDHQVTGEPEHGLRHLYTGIAMVQGYPKAVGVHDGTEQGRFHRVDEPVTVFEKRLPVGASHAHRHRPVARHALVEHDVKTEQYGRPVGHQCRGM